MTTDQDLADISRFVELGKTPVIIAQNHYFLPREGWMRRRQKLLDFVHRWAESWKNEDFARYISHYHPRHYSDSFRKNYQQFKHYKQAVFSRPGKPHLEISQVSIMGEKDSMVVRLIQKYRSQTLSDTGQKTLYLVQNSSYQWKIIHESWSRLEKTASEVVFTPSQRFFTQQAKN